MNFVFTLLVCSKICESGSQLSKLQSQPIVPRDVPEHHFFFYLAYDYRSSTALIWTKRKHANTLYAFPSLLQQGNSDMKMALG